jgi:hypothetical protein
MAEEFGGVHTIERRSGVERRASNWRDAVEQQHEARRRQCVTLVAALDALVQNLGDVIAHHHELHRQTRSQHQLGLANGKAAVQQELIAIQSRYREPR